MIIEQILGFLETLYPYPPKPLPTVRVRVLGVRVGVQLKYPRVTPDNPWPQLAIKGLASYVVSDLGDLK